MPRAQVPAVMLTAALAAACYVSACSSGSTASAAASSTPGAVLADWIHQVAVGNRSAACLDMREPGLSAQRSAAACMSAAGSSLFNSFHGNFVADGIKSGTPVSVSAAHVTGSSATVDGSDIHVSATTLDRLMTKHSIGVKPGQLAVSFGLSRIDGAWYVTNVNMNI
jgi:hypothetical protein